MGDALADATALRERVARIFSLAPLVVDLGIEFVDAGAGWCETAMAGAAAQTHCGPGERVARFNGTMAVVGTPPR